jgi:hypothetical protein
MDQNVESMDEKKSYISVKKPHAKEPIREVDAELIL